MQFAEKLQLLRKEKGFTQEQLAEQLFVSRTAISKWESNRGYPSIDSLRALSKLFSVSIDNLLSGEELITIAEADNQAKTRRLRGLMLGVLDCMVALLFFLPFFAQKEADIVHAVSLLSLSTAFVLRLVFILFVAVTTVFGIAQLALQNMGHPLWLKSKTVISLFLTVVGTFLFIVSPQPYAAAFMLCLLGSACVLLYGSAVQPMKDRRDARKRDERMTGTPSPMA